MKIALRKVTKIPLDFDVSSEDITFKGFLQYHFGKLVLLKAKLSGTLDIECDICAKEYKLNIEDDIEFYLSDGMYEDTGDLELDVVESLDSTVNIEDVLHSEIELLKSDYHTCEDCEDSELDLEII